MEEVQRTSSERKLVGDGRGPWRVTHVNADDDKFGLERKKP